MNQRTHCSPILSSSVIVVVVVAVVVVMALIFLQSLTVFDTVERAVKNSTAMLTAVIARCANLTLT